MKTSDSLTKIAPALLAAQGAITFAKKDAKNPHFKSTYADLPAVIDAVKQALNDNLITFLQSGSPAETGHLYITTRLLHASGEWIEDTMPIPLQKNDAQGIGSAMTYGRRYMLAAMCGLYQDDDDGHAASQPKATKPEPKAAKEEQKEALPASSVQAWIANIDASGNLDDLREATRAALDIAKSAGDKIAFNKLKNHAAIVAQKFEGVQA